MRIFFSLVCLSVGVSAAPAFAAPPISLEHVRIETTTLSPARLRAATMPAQLALVQFDGPLRREWAAALRAAGVQRLGYLPTYAYLVATDRLRLAELAQLPGVRWVGPYLADYKLHPAFLPAATAGPVWAAVGIARALVGTEAELADLTDVIVAHRDEETTRWLRVQLDAARIADLAALPAVVAVEPEATPELDGERAAQIAAGAFRPGDNGPNGGYYDAWLDEWGVDGTGVVVQVMDDGLEQGLDSNAPGSAHPDLIGRIAGIDNATGDRDGDSARGHGSLNAGIIAGSAAAGLRDRDGFLLGQGIAPGAQIYASKIFNNRGTFELGAQSITAVVERARRSGATISNNSWGTRLNGFYTAQSREFDLLARDSDRGSPGDQGMLFVFSAGNTGPFPGTVGAPRTAKNVLVVGASENSDADGADGCGNMPRQADHAGDLAPFSSRGPVNDGRFGPHLVAVGTHVNGPASTSARYEGVGVCDPYWPPGQNFYARSSGTSHAAPIVSAAAALFAEHYRRVRGAHPSPALLKAVLLAACDDMAGGDDGFGGTLGHVPDMDQGWGRLNLQRLLRDDAVWIDQRDVLRETGARVSYLVAVRDPSLPLRAALVWTDAPAVPLANPVLVNDLDLRVTARADNSAYWGNVFQGGRSVAGGDPDRINTVECVWIDRPVGLYEIEVLAARIADDGVPALLDDLDQDFALVVVNAELVPGRGTLTLDAHTYRCDGTARLTLRDADLSDSEAVTVAVELEQEAATSVLLARSAPGVFHGELALAPLAADHDQRLRVMYHDADDGTGAPRTTTAEVRLDCRPPQVVSLLVFDVLERTGTLRWSADEPCEATVTLTPFGVGPPIVFSATPLLVTHQVALKELAVAARYRLELTLTDSWGNAGTVIRPEVVQTGRFTTVHDHGLAAWQAAVLSGASQGWRQDSSGGTPHWHSGPAAATEGAATLTSRLLDLRGITRPSRLALTHRYDFEVCGNPARPADGGLLELRREHETFWRILAPAGGYPGRLDQTCRNPLEGLHAFVGDSKGIRTDLFDLSPYNGERVHVRARVGWDCDNCRAADGWRIYRAAVVELHTPADTPSIEFYNPIVACSDSLRVVARADTHAGAGFIEAMVGINEGPLQSRRLLERDVASGVFDGHIAIGGSDGGMAVGHDDEIQVRLGATAAFARVDCAPPVISQVRLENHHARDTVQVAWNTDEPASGLVLYGTAPGVYSATAEAPLLGFTQRPTLFVPGSGVYYCAIEARDRIGNTARDTNQGAHYRIDMSTPSLVVAPAAIHVSLAEGQATVAALTLRNAALSGRDVSWKVNAFVAVDTGGENRPPRASDHVGGPDAFGYTWISSLHSAGPAPEWIELGAEATVVKGLYDDSLSHEFSLGWLFPFYGQGWGALRIGSNGYLTFNSFVQSGGNTGLPNPFGPAWMVAPFWDDLIMAADSRVLFHVDETRAVVTWERVPRLFGHQPFTFQAVLLRNGRIRFNYRSVGTPADRATVGIQDGGARGLTVLLNELYLRDGLTIEIVPGVSWLTLDSREGMLPAGQALNLGLFLNADSLPPGDYRASLAVTSNAGDVTVPLRLTVNALQPRGAATLDRAAYRCADRAMIEVRDRSSLESDRVSVVAAGPRGATREVELQRVSPGVFAGVLAVETLAMQHGDVLLVEYADADDGAGMPAVAAATAAIDCVPPRVVSFDVIDIGAQRARIRWQTDEPTTGIVLLGQRCESAIPAATAAVLHGEQEVTVSGFVPDNEHALALLVSDAAGNLMRYPESCLALYSRPLVCEPVAGNAMLSPTANTGAGNLLEMRVDARLADVIVPMAQVEAQTLRVRVYEFNADLSVRAVLHDRLLFDVPAGGRDLALGPLDLTLRAGGLYAAMLFWEHPLAVGWEANDTNPVLNFARVRSGLLSSWFNLPAPGPTGVNFRMRYCFEPVEQPAATLSFDAELYGCGGTASLLLRDSDLAGQGTANVELRAGDHVQPVTLAETDTASWTFRGTVSLGPQGLAVADGDVLTARYDDADDGAGAPRVVSATAEIDCAAPIIFDVAATSVGYTTAIVTWRTERPARSRVLFAETTCAPYPFAVTQNALTTVHAVELAGLEQDRTYRFAVEAESVGGLVARDDNRGGCYELRTLPVRRVLCWTGAASGDNRLTLFNIQQAIRSAQPAVRFDEFRGLSLERAQLDSYHVLLIPPQEAALPETLRVLGAAWRPVLEEFLAAGGVVVALDHDRAAWPLLAGAELLSVDGVTSVTRRTTVAAADDPLLTGFAGAHYCAPRSAAFAVSEGTAVLVAFNGNAHVWRRSAARGDVVLIGHDFTVPTRALSRIAANAVTLLPAPPTAPLTLRVTKSALRCSDAAVVTLTSPHVLNEPRLLSVSTSSGATSTVPLTPHSRLPGVYTGVLRLGAGALPVQNGETVTIAYEDVERQLTVDCAPPEIVDASEVVADQQRAWRLTVRASEATTARLFTGSICGVADATAVSPLGVEHKFSIPLSARRRPLLAWIELEDEAGNITRDSCRPVPTDGRKAVAALTAFADARPGRELENTLNTLTSHCAASSIVACASIDTLPALLETADALLIPEQPYLSAASAEHFAETMRVSLERFVIQGGVLIVCDPVGALAPRLLPLAAGRYESGFVFAGSAARRALRWTDPAHRLADGDPAARPGPDLSGVYSDPRGFFAPPLGEVLRVNARGDVAIGWRRSGAGAVLLLGHDYLAPDAAFAQALGNAACRLPYPPDGTATLTLSAARYGCADLVVITLLDGDLRGAGGAEVQAASSRASRTIRLEELGGASGVFEGSLTLTLDAAAGALPVSEQDTLTVWWEDASPARTLTATATIDCRPPVITALAVTDIGPDGATITWTTSTPATTRVELGRQTCSEVVYDDPARVIVHRAVLTALEPATTYRFAVASTDAAQRTTRDDNEGTCYTLTTTAGKRVLVLTEFANTGPEGEVEAVLAALRSVTDNFVWRPLPAAGDLAAWLPRTDVVLTPPQRRAQPSQLAFTGLAWRDPLTAFVRNGGVAVFCDAEGDAWPIANTSGLLTITRGQVVTGERVRLAAPGNALLAGVTSSYIAPVRSSSFVTAEGEVVVDASPGFPVVINKPLGNGNVVLLGHDYRASTAETRRMLANAVFALPAAGQATPTPRPVARVYTEVLSGNPAEAGALFVVGVSLSDNRGGFVGSYAFEMGFPPERVEYVSIADGNGGMRAGPQAFALSGRVRFSAFNVQSQLRNGRLCVISLRARTGPGLPYAITLADFGNTGLVTVDLLPIEHIFDTSATAALGGLPPRPLDLFELARHWKTAWPPGDLAPDGEINGADLILFMQQFRPRGAR